MVSGKQLMEETKKQVLKKSDVNGLDVGIWLVRHVGNITFMVPILITVMVYFWAYHVAPKVDERASRLDTLITAPIIAKQKENDCKIKDTYYLVKKMELVQNRTAPSNIVRDAEEEIEVEKFRRDDN